MSVAETNRAAVKEFLERSHAGDLAVIDTKVAENIVTHGFPCGRSPASREEYKAFFVGFGEAFTNMEYRTLSLVADEHSVAARFFVAVDHTGEYNGHPATGRRVTFEGMGLYRMQNGQIAETWLQLDGVSFLSQIGAIAAAA